MPLNGPAKLDQDACFRTFVHFLGAQAFCDRFFVRIVTFVMN